MIKVVAQAIPTYAMRCFDLTKSMFDSIIQLACMTHTDKEDIMHWVSWEKMCLSKSEGGLGFLDLHLLNMAMLAW